MPYKQPALVERLRDFRKLYRLNPVDAALINEAIVALTEASAPAPAPSGTAPLQAHGINIGTEPIDRRVGERRAVKMVAMTLPDRRFDGPSGLPEVKK